MDALGRSYHKPKDPNGVITVTPLRLDVLQFIHRFPYAPTHYIDHHFTASQWQIRTELFSKGYVKKSIKAYNTSEDTGSLALMPKNSWSLTKKGEALLAAHRPTEPFIPLGRFNDHQLYSTLIGTSLLYGAKELGLTFGFTDDILKHPNCPPITTDHPFSFTAPGHSPLTADARPFKLTYENRAMFFWGFEADRKTESLNSEAKNSIVNKYRRYEAMLNARYYETFGLSSINVLFVTISPEHLKNMLALFKDTVDPAWHKNFWFTTYAHSPSLDFPEPSGVVLTQPWHTTAGVMSLTQYLKGGGST